MSIVVPNPNIASDNNPVHPSTVSVRTILRRSHALARRLEPHGQSAFLLVMRLLYGWLFMQTGWGKWTHFDRTSEFFATLHLPAPAFTAGMVGSIELAGGLLLVLGAGTRYASALLVGVLSTALATAHAEDAFSSLSSFIEQEPYPFLVAVLLLLAFGAGRWSIDRWMAGRPRASATPPGPSRIAD